MKKITKKKRTKSLTKLRAKIKLAQYDFFTFCNLLYPSFFKKERKYIVRLCNMLQTFYESNTRVMIINLPPRFGKSFTAQLFTCWILGKNKLEKIMTGSYNQTLSGTFAESVRNIIMQEKIDDNIVYSDIFPETKIKYGDAAKTMWSLEGCQEKSYLSTSPGGSATGFGATLEIMDDLIKTAEEAFNDIVKDNHFNWFKNTMLSRQEGNRKILIIMTRWRTNDLAGRMLDDLGDVFSIDHINLKAEENGEMLCEDVLDRESWEILKKTLDPNILAANYLQEPIDIKGKLYSKFSTYDKLPRDDKDNILFSSIKAYVDTADTGSDYLCGIVYGVHERYAYILDVLYTKDSMETTEGALAEMLFRNKVNICDIESNNGGRGFARSVQRILDTKYPTHQTIINTFHQSKNKEARILSNSTFVMNNILYPINWANLWSDYYKAMNTYQREGKNAHDDAQDATTGVAEKIFQGEGMSVLK